ncbi:S66 peptidase family protein [Lentzea albida]|uniref:Muramoyltetrapeptide carboxypeptidase n=1 Tax=Lentzea albida TaxID=65499 RepID=A0A1H9A6I5_9PSEU|nr:LD-carboxypeptidase [Lentzea albida]SEP72093.1 muramoyltetrapeptide carboxypeptidase [Lentzea albida]
MNVVLPPRVAAGDRVRLVSPASFPDEEGLAESVRVLESWGLVVEIGEHAVDRHGYMAGRDADRLADLNDAYRDPGVWALFATRGGAGAYRIAHDVDFDAVKADPKPLVGFSDITSLHLALWRHCRVAGVHGFLAGARSEASTRSLLMETEPAVLHRDASVLTAAVRVGGVATGNVVGGHLGTLAWSVGTGTLNLDGTILFVEAPRAVGLGHVDRQLTQLIRSGSLRGVRGVVLGRFPGFEDYSDRDWTVLDVLRDRLEVLDVPVLGGVDVGHGEQPLSLALGPIAELDADAGTLTVGPAVR